MVFVNAEEIRACYDFACFAWNNQSQSSKQFGTDEERDPKAFIADQMTGKIAEIIFKKQIEQSFSNVRVDLNFQHYLNPLETDQGDVSIYIDNQLLQLKIDIKSSSYKAQWMLVENHKYIDFNTRRKMSDRYVMVKFHENMPSNIDLGKNPQQILNLNYVSGEIVGWAIHEEFIVPFMNRPWFQYNRGERLISTKFIPATNVKLNKLKLDEELNRIPDSKKRIGKTLDANVNYGLPIKWLNKDLRTLLIL